MLSLLLKLKSFLPSLSIVLALAGISYGWYWHGQYNKSQAKNIQLIQQLADCQVNQEMLESAVQRWKAAAAKQDAQLKRKEALVASNTDKSNKRIRTILNTPYSDNCDKAVSQALDFIWNNNIP